MAGWVTATGRTLGILVCSGMLLVSATLGQNGQTSPPRSIPPIAVEAASDGGAEADQQSRTVTLDAVAEESSATVPTPSNPEEPQPQAKEPATLSGGYPVPQAGSGITPPQEDFRFNKAVPVRMAPVRLQIPAAWVDADIQAVGVTPEGEMETPDDFWEVGWYRYGTRPGDAGRAVIAGHLDSYDGAAVFYHIGDLEPGDEMRVLLGGPDGERTYAVREIAIYPADDAPVEQIFGPSDHPQLVLITCGGDWRGSDAGGYSDRIVVYADMIMPDVAGPDTDLDNPATS